MASTFPDDPAEWPRIIADQNRLEPDVRRVAEYGGAHPGEWVGVRLDNGRPVRVVAAFTDNLPLHEQALRALVDHPERLTVERQPYSARRLEQIRRELQTQLCDRDERAAFGLATMWARIMVELRAWAEDVARQLHERYGDALEITVGALPYPPRPFSSCPQRPEPTVALDGLELRLDLDQHSVRSGDSASGRLFLRNAGHRPLELETWQPAVGVTTDGDGDVAGVFRGVIAGTGYLLRLGPAEEDSLRALVGTASCASRFGYVLPPGRYSAVVPLHVYGDRAPTGEKFGVLVSPPATLILT